MGEAEMTSTIAPAAVSITLESHDHSMRRVFPRIARVANSDALAFSRA
jgi:hypothetical protein